MSIDIQANKERFIELLKSTGREGVDDLIDYLEDGKNDFFKAPASTRFHLSEEGGCCQHSLNTCDAALKLRDIALAQRPDLAASLTRESVIVAALLHDINKSDIYKPVTKKVKGAFGLWEEVPGWDVDYSNLPLGHGEKSAIMALWSGFEIYEEELIAIRWHMTAWDLAFQSPEAKNNINTARDKYPLVALLQLADGMAANIFEREL
ncbi:MAG: HD family phosphohydrolase [Bacteroidales bacterium]|uniref:HD domain-containing protein n=1 Tax=Sodaliphilus sp. TaxID=2815818 RepID=UPI001B6CB702|nr:HD family phosphohydrolase [Candidatus Sodaliphilus limicaballi]